MTPVSHSRGMMKYAIQIVPSMKEPPLQYASRPKSAPSAEIPISVVPLIQVAATEKAMSQTPECRPATAMSSTERTRRRNQTPTPSMRAR